MTERLDATPPPDIAQRGLKSFVKGVLPAFLASMIRDCQGLPAPVVFTYLRLRALRSVRLRSDRGKLRRHPRSLLFVCHGNIMRSPVAAELFRQPTAGRPIREPSRLQWTSASHSTRIDRSC